MLLISKYYHGRWSSVGCQVVGCCYHTLIFRDCSDQLVFFTVKYSYKLAGKKTGRGQGLIDLASFPGLPRLQLLIACSGKRSKTGAGQGLGMRLIESRLPYFLYRSADMDGVSDWFIHSRKNIPFKWWWLRHNGRTASVQVMTDSHLVLFSSLRVCLLYVCLQQDFVLTWNCSILNLHGTN